MKSLFLMLLLIVSVLSSAAQTNLLTEIAKLLPVGKCKVDVMENVYPKRFMELSEKLQVAVATNKDWWLNYVKRAKVGEPLAYQPNMGMTKDEYAEFSSLGEKRKLEKTGEGLLQVVTNSNSYQFDGGSTLPDLTGLRIDLKKLTIITPFGVLKKPTFDESSGGPSLGAFSGYRWQFEQGDMDKGDITTASFLIGKLKESRRPFIYYKGGMMKANNLLSDVRILIFYDKK